MLQKREFSYSARHPERKPSFTRYWVIGGAILLIVLSYVAFGIKTGTSAASVVTGTPAASTATLASSFTYLKSVSAPTGLNQNFLTQVTDCLIPAAAVYGYDLYEAAGFRSYDEQNALYDQGRTVDGHIVTNAQGGESMHNFGYAVDLADHENGENIDYNKLGNIAAWCGLEHGDRGYTDLPHFEYRGGLSIEEFQNGMRPANLTLPCALLASKATLQDSLTLADLTSCGAPTFTDQPATAAIGGNQD